MVALPSMFKGLGGVTRPQEELIKKAAAKKAAIEAQKKKNLTAPTQTQITPGSGIVGGFMKAAAAATTPVESVSPDVGKMREVRQKAIAPKPKKPIEILMEQHRVLGDKTPEKTRDYFKQTDDYYRKLIQKTDKKRFDKLDEGSKNRIKLWEKKIFIADKLRSQYNIPDNIPDSEIFEDFKQQNPEGIRNILGDVEEKIQEDIAAGESTLAGRIGEMGARKTQRGYEAIEAYKKGEQTLAETAGQIGAAAGSAYASTIFDLGLEGVKALIPEKAKKAAGDKANKAFMKIMKTEKGRQFFNAVAEGGESVMKRYEGMDPRDRRNFDAVVDITEFAGFKKGGAALKRGLKKAVGKETKDILVKGIKAGEELAERTAKQSAQKAAAKKAAGILPMITEKGTAAAKRAAQKEGRLLEPKQTKIGKLLFGEKGASIIPTQKTQRGAKVISEMITKPSKVQSELYRQVDDLNVELAKKLSNRVKDIKIGSMTQAKKTMKESIVELSELTNDFTKKDIKNMKQVLSAIDKAKTGDDLLELRKGRDKLFPSSVKKASSMSAPSTQKARKLWLEVRSALNDGLDDVAKRSGDEGVKKSLADQAALFEVLKNLDTRAGDIGKGLKKGLLSKENLKKAAVIGGGGLIFGRLRDTLTGGQ